MISHNEKIYASLLNSFNVYDIHDRKLLANRFSKAYKKHSCCDNYRICLSDVNKKVTDQYIAIESQGCCGFFDEYISNPITGNCYWIGFNHGH